MFLFFPKLLGFDGGSLSFNAQFMTDKRILLLQPQNLLLACRIPRPGGRGWNSAPSKGTLNCLSPSWVINIKRRIWGDGSGTEKGKTTLRAHKTEEKPLKFHEESKIFSISTAAWQDFPRVVSTGNLLWKLLKWHPPRTNFLWRAGSLMERKRRNKFQFIAFLDTFSHPLLCLEPGNCCYPAPAAPWRSSLRNLHLSRRILWLREESLPLGAGLNCEYLGYWDQQLPTGVPAEMQEIASLVSPAVILWKWM